MLWTATDAQRLSGEKRVKLQRVLAAVAVATTAAELSLAIGIVATVEHLLLARTAVEPLVADGIDAAAAELLLLR